MGVTCFKPTGEPVIDSFRTAGPPDPRNVTLAMNLSTGIQALGITYLSNRVLCKYRRMLDGSGNFMANLTTDQFAIWAYGNQDTGPGRHNANDFGRSDAVVNLQFEPQVIYCHCLLILEYFLKATHRFSFYTFLS